MPILPIFDPDHTSTKDKIISILADNPGLTTKRINNLLRKQFAINVTYQAVHKLLKQTVDQNVIEFDGKKYYINEVWIEQLKNFISNIKKEEDSSNKKFSDPGKAMAKIREIFPSLQMINFKFKTLRDLDTFLIVLEEYCIDTSNLSSQEFAFMQKHIRQPIMYPNYKKELQKKYAMKKVTGYIVCEGDTILDNWAAEFYANQNISVRTNISYDFEED